MKAHLDQLEREVVRILGAIRSLEEVSVPSAAKLLKKSKKFVRATFPLVIHGAKSHHIKVSDIAAYQEKRTLRPTENGHGGA